MKEPKTQTSGYNPLLSRGLDDHCRGQLDAAEKMIEDYEKERVALLALLEQYSRTVSVLSSIVARKTPTPTPRKEKNDDATKTK